ncbi:hypothetical protein N7471_003294 [Penicillium samsonianum]|uniref:uncharacterized protein n=1 Tax=Penicillium samsonianum TaxID=1882272 RepID=UPI0025466E44|nr:uncharacterized protein N7471_003294 [Penicillium samsonianum]KAJ6143841.1 hypothetical protein N7471_003294 [Penicillium samsonianum]
MLCSGGYIQLLHSRKTLSSNSFVSDLNGRGVRLGRFQGDEVGDPEWFYPPLGWTPTWDGAHITSVECWLKREMVARGYVMWDATRLDSMGVKDKLELRLDDSLTCPDAPGERTLSPNPDRLINEDA